MAAERPLFLQNVPKENFARGLLQVDIPELGVPIQGKVRDSWVVGGDRVMVTTDRQSAFDAVLCTVPGKGQALNLISAYWFEMTQDIVPNHLISIPHPNVIIARQAVDTLPVEMVLRRYMAQSSTTTSIYHNYVDRKRRSIYGIDFPEGLRSNQEFPMGTILTPTTKAEAGSHDEELADDQACEIVDGRLGTGTWKKAKDAALAVFERSREIALDKGLILVDTKYEFGIDKNGNLMLIDEVNTPDSSRYWLAETYGEKFRVGKTPDTFDKEILRRWLAEHGFRGNGPVLKIDPAIIDEMAKAYAIPYKMITGKDLPDLSLDQPSVREAVLSYIASH